MPTHTVRGMARVRSGQAPAWPLVSDRRRCRGSAVKGGRKAISERKREAPLTVVGHARTLSGPSPDRSVITAVIFSGCVVVDQVITVKSSAGRRR
jgi:hypothetical protein